MPATSTSAGNEVGQQLTFVAHIDGVPHSDQVVVVEAAPFVVEANASWCRGLRRSMRAVLLKPESGTFAKSEVEIVSLSKFRNTFRIGFEAPAWHATDRRRFPRFEVDVPTLLRKVCETEGEIRIEAQIARTQDLSSGGAWLVGESNMANGTVAQVELNLNGNVCRTLSVVVRNEPGREGFAVEFLDFVGSSRYLLSEFLRLAA